MENDSRYKAYARFKNKELLKGHKASAIVAGLKDYTGKSTKVVCDSCQRVCFQHISYQDVSDLVKENPGILCPYCVIQDEIDPEMKKILDSAIFDFERTR